MVNAAYYHIVPVADSIEHRTNGKSCPCRPAVKPDDSLVVHNAIDNREFDEIAEEINLRINDCLDGQAL